MWTWFYYGKQRQLEYDFLVAPGADPKDIRLNFEGAEKISLDEEGNLVLHMYEGAVVQHTPEIYQEINGMKETIAGGYVPTGQAPGHLWNLRVRSNQTTRH